MQGTTVEVRLAGTIDKVGGARKLTVTYQVALSVLTGTISVLPALEVTVGDDNPVGFGIECQCLSFVNTGIPNRQVIERYVIGSHVDGSSLVYATAVGIGLVPRDNRVLTTLTDEVSIGSVDLYMVFVDTVLDINIIWCTVVGCGIDGSLNGVHSAFAHNGVDSEGTCCRLVFRI